MDSSFYDIGKFSLSYIIKSALRSDAHSHERQMSAKADHARRSKSVLLGREWNCEGVRSTLRRRGVMSLKRPAAGGESCEQDSFLYCATSQSPGLLLCSCMKKKSKI